jgi:hypothetical protein
MHADPIRRATLQRGASAVRGHSFRVLWGTASNERALGQPVFVKQLSDDRFAVELVCAWLARALNLPAPEPLLITVNRAVWPKAIPWPHGPAQVATYFGTRAVPNAQPIAKGAAEVALAKLLLNWPKLIDVAIFDHLIANDDRNNGNILLDADRKLWIIDHERAIGAGAGMLFSDAFPRFENSLLNRVASMSPAARFDLRPQIVDLVGACRHAVAAIPYSDMNIGEDMSALIQTFLEKRLVRLLPMVLQTLGIAELGSDGLQDSQRPAQ